MTSERLMRRLQGYPLCDECYKMPCTCTPLVESWAGYPVKKQREWQARRREEVRGFANDHEAYMEAQRLATQNASRVSRKRNAYRLDYGLGREVIVSRAASWWFDRVDGRGADIGQEAEAVAEELLGLLRKAAA